MRGELFGHPSEPNPSEGPSNPLERPIKSPPGVEHPVEDAQVELECDGDFVQEQREDPSLSQSWEQAVTPDQEGDNMPHPPQGPQFEIWGDCLYQVVQEPQTREVI